MIFAHAYKWKKTASNWSHSSSVTSLKHLLWLQSCEKAMGWCIAQCKMLLFCVKPIVKESCNFELHIPSEEEEKRKKTFWFGTYLWNAFFHIIGYVVYYENTGRWMACCYKDFISLPILIFWCYQWVSAHSLHIKSTDSIVKTSQNFENNAWALFGSVFYLTLQLKNSNYFNSRDIPFQ